MIVVATIELQLVSFQEISEKASLADTDKIPRPSTIVKPIFFRGFKLSCHINVAGNTARAKSVTTLIAGRISKETYSQDSILTYTLENTSNTLELEDSNNHLPLYDSRELGLVCTVP